MTFWQRLRPFVLGLLLFVIFFIGVPGYFLVGVPFVPQLAERLHLPLLCYLEPQAAFDSHPRGDCLGHLAYVFRDDSLCHAARASGGYSGAFCFQKVMMATGDIGVCDRLADWYAQGKNTALMIVPSWTTKENMIAGNSYDTCYLSYFADMHKWVITSETCQPISNPDIRAMCLAWVPANSGDQCEAVMNSYLKNTCYRIKARYSGDVSLCLRLQRVDGVDQQWQCLGNIIAAGEFTDCESLPQKFRKDCEQLLQKH